MKPRILIVDDEKNIRRTLSMILKSAGYTTREASSGEEALTMIDEAPSDAVLLDIGLPGMSGMELLRVLRSDHGNAGVIMISGQATVAAAVEATRLGAIDFLEKPLSKDRVLIAVRNALQISSLGATVGRLQKSESQRHLMIGESRAMEKLRAQVKRIGPTGATVLITGESGSGKELVARMLHEFSSVASGPFVKVNCAAIPEELIETELFGCVKGAYTGADRSRDGKFLLADGGTIFLDEIGDMSLRVQAKVLRALQEKEIERVGDSATLKVKVRVLAATNKDLMDEVAAQRFREDLYYRLNVVPLSVPPLRERRCEISLLSNHFLQLYAGENDLPPKSLSQEAQKLLEERRWRGNIRELRNVIERLAILSPGEKITAEDVHLLAPEGGAHARASGRRPSTGSAGPDLEEIREMGGLVQARREYEKHCIEVCLDKTGGNVSQAAQWLGIERSNLHKKIQSYGLDKKTQRPGESTPGEDENYEKV
ncbi:MAG: sigma-54 dependent transcriptional regulator [Candidatus Eisenbacteria bacterium]|uniref:Sigma-54 dependent transcriptional regulator n=1 Tax=Eiseniibacteriota bacterium TaxID=2212470 RepID=A0A948RSS3_UNCEI|nr:sigma-54 dependent transcriptional regulator [Candidatus Eisenbacteria bacterium]MBU1950012.1 sigma-54 dependent transcriptional regulator [Candidatus Eisenbacteria bacterium]MBU2689916.1 sigma-54 dependent transcriptional regulator [Candidatus Eisenbacteria bacterium]